METGYDHVSRIAAAIENLFGEGRLTLESGAVASTRFTDTLFIRDGEPDSWHWTAQLNLRVLAA